MTIPKIKEQLRVDLQTAQRLGAKVTRQPQDMNCCCALSACQVVDPQMLKTEPSIINVAMKRFNITAMQAWSIICGFDAKNWKDEKFLDKAFEQLGRELSQEFVK